MNLHRILRELEERFSHWGTRADQITSVINYLEKYGYVKVMRELTVGDIVDAIRKFQMMAGLVQDGELGPKTYRATSWPRCAVPDHLAMKVEFGKWRGKRLTYYMAGRDNDVSSEQWDEAFATAFRQWSEVADLTFVRTNTPSANIRIDVGQGRQDNFDGSGGTLAWAQLPPNNNFNGTLLTKYDKGETWVVDPRKNGILLVNVACHEIGHLLGLEHSRVSGALMAPFYNRSITKPQPNDDISRIVRLYGEPQGGIPDPDPDPDPQPEPDVAAPSSLVATRLSATKIRLQWRDNSTGEDEFEIYRNGTILGGVGRGYTTFLDNTAPREKLTYAVRARIADRYSDFSNPLVIENSPEPTPDPEQLRIEIEGQISSINIPGYRVTKIG